MASQLAQNCKLLELWLYWNNSVSGMSGGKVSGSERGCVGAALGASWR